MTCPLPVESIERGADWLRRGPDGDVVISSRVRLARNLAGMSFPGRMNGGESTRLMRVTQSAVSCLQLKVPKPDEVTGPFAGLAPGLRPEKIVWISIGEMAVLDRALLVERHLISKEHARSDRARAACFTLPDERLSIMVNEEDHLRLQCVAPGLSLSAAWEMLDDVDDQIEAHLDMAFLPQLGYLTACPTNVGCAARMSVMLHLPAIRLAGEMEHVKRAAKDMNLTVRGFYGEGSEAAGDLFQISNQTTLGRSEQQLCEQIESRVVPQVVAFERKVREELVSTKRRYLEDQIFRALGAMKFSRQLTPEEATASLSLVRLGVHCGMITGIEPQAVTQLILLTQPAHLQRLLGREMDQQRRREARADLVRQRLEKAGG